MNTSVVGDRDLTGDVFVWTDNIYANRNKLSDIDPAFSGIVTAFCERTDVFELEKDAVKKVTSRKK